MKCNTYFGARYYDSNLSIWLSVYTERVKANCVWGSRSVDPMASERSWVSPYSYCQNSPVMRVDPTGALDDWYETPSGEDSDRLQIFR
jgi:RHS repeat-associated protein